MNRERVWVTGAGGLIGNYLVQTAARCAPSAEVVGLTRVLDLTNFAAVDREFKAQSPSAIIHCAAMSRSPECQANPDKARKINIDATRHLAQLAADRPFVFFSTDLVFDGQRGNYTETDSVNPLSVYAETKVAAEQAVLANPRHIVVRTSLNSGVSPTRDRGFDEQIHKSWEEGQTLNLFIDEFRSPVGAEITAIAVWELLRDGQPGLYHVAGSERLSRWKIGELLALRWPQFAARMNRGSIKDWRGAPRPADTSFNCSKVQALLSFQLPRWSDWMKNT